MKAMRCHMECYRHATSANSRTDEGEDQFHACRVISQTRPSACQSKRALPFSWPIISSIIRVPNPRCVGFFTAGPPVSLQWRASCPSASCNHFRLIRPLGTDSAPYLAALVANSCKATGHRWRSRRRLFCRDWLHYETQHYDRQRYGRVHDG
jgi:hypothetical protein